MNDVAELKQFVTVHTRAQGMSDEHRDDVLGRIHDDGSWAREWLASAERLESGGKHLEACRDYALARFPYAGDPVRSEAGAGAVRSFDRWRRDNTDVTPLELDVPGGRMRCWATGLAPDRPLLLVMGGIVSLKEQWAQVLLSAPRLGMAAVVAEMPGVGENTTSYRPDSHLAISALLDALHGRADVTRTYAIALSFSGHLLLRAAAADPRIRGVVTSGAPVHEFFTDRDWLGRVPEITLDTLAHLSGTGREQLPGELAGHALRDDELAALDIPVSYLVSGRDEIIPPREPEHLCSRVAGVRLTRHDDVHGSPAHVAESRLWIVLSLLRMRGGRRPQRAALSAALGLARARAALRGSR